MRLGVQWTAWMNDAAAAAAAASLRGGWVGVGLMMMKRRERL